jgi:hypothetical protein
MGTAKVRDKEISDGFKAYNAGRGFTSGLPGDNGRRTVSAVVQRSR